VALIYVGFAASFFHTAQEKSERLTQFPEENPDPALRVTGEGAILYAKAPPICYNLQIVTEYASTGARREIWDSRVTGDVKFDARLKRIRH